MKKIIFSFLLILISLSSYCQINLKGAFDTKEDQYNRYLTIKKTTDTLSISNNNVWMSRLALTATGIAIPLKGGTTVTPLTIVITGMGLSYGKYTKANYCRYGFNTFVVYSTQYNNTSSTEVGGMVTIGVCNNKVATGILYANPSGDGYQFYLIIGLNFTF